jgi:hypothetical protein
MFQRGMNDCRMPNSLRWAGVTAVESSAHRWAGVTAETQLLWVSLREKKAELESVWKIERVDPISIL